MEFPLSSPQTVIESLIDTYFTYSHGQPYSYFHEETFRQKLADSALPKCLLLAVLASALRFSNHEYFQGTTREATEAYARESWLSVLNDHMTADNTPRFYVAQTTNILAVVDFTGMRSAALLARVNPSRILTNRIPLSFS